MNSMSKKFLVILCSPIVFICSSVHFVHFFLQVIQDVWNRAEGIGFKQQQWNMEFEQWSRNSRNLMQSSLFVIDTQQKHTFAHKYYRSTSRLLFVCLFGVYRPTREFFTHMETSVQVGNSYFIMVILYFAIRMKL